MARTYSTKNTNAHGETWIREQFIVEFGYSTPVRYSSRETLTWNGDSFTAMDMEAAIKTNGSTGTLVIRDDNFVFSSIVVAQGTAGITAQVREVSGDGSWGPSDADFLFEGEIGPTQMKGDVWTLKLVPSKGKYMPDILVNEANGFNHLPPEGTEFHTPNGIIVLERSR